MTPEGYYASGAFIFFVGGSGSIGHNRVDTVHAIRPSISLKSEIKVGQNGDGSVTNPFVVESSD